jgi:hypothetical protein
MADKFYAVQVSAWPSVEQGDEDYGDNEATTTVRRRDARMLVLTATVGTGSDVCASTDTITVSAGTPAFYCYQMTNQGDVYLSTHDLSDDQLGDILSDYAHDLLPGETFTWIESVILTRTAVGTVTWIASNAPYTFIVTDTVEAHLPVYLPLVLKASGN